MKSKMILAIILCLSSAYFAFSESIVRVPDPNQSLSAKLTWASIEAKAHAGTGRKNFWIGYSIQRLMDSRSFFIEGESMMIGWMTFDSNDLTLGELLNGKIVEDPADVRKEAAAQLNDQNGKNNKKGMKTLREVAILIQFSSAGNAEQFSAMSLNVPIQEKKFPLYWLGPVSEPESYSYLTSKYSATSIRKNKKTLIGLIGLHQSPGLAFPFLRDILANSTDEDFRQKATSWLGEQNSEEALKLLIQTVDNDISEEVQKTAVWAIADMDTKTANDSIMNFARSHPSEEVRKSAICALEDVGSDQALKVLEEISWSDPDQEFRSAAMSTLADFPGGRGVPALIKILREHPSKESRKSAIWMLQDTNDPRAKQALLKMITQ